MLRLERLLGSGTPRQIALANCSEPMFHPMKEAYINIDVNSLIVRIEVP